MCARAYYSKTIAEFKSDTKETIFSALCGDRQFPTNSKTKKSWKDEIDILKSQMPTDFNGRILLEYNIPRMGHRVDAVLLANGIVILLEFKIVKEVIATAEAKRQVLDYGLDLADFHSATHNRKIVTLAVIKGYETNSEIMLNIESAIKFPDGSNIADPVAIGTDDLGVVLKAILAAFHEPAFDYDGWEDADYKPSPSIIEYERELYKNHNVEDITRKGAGDTDLLATTKAVQEVIDECKKTKGKKALVFVAGVPGAGKTLIGLNLSNALGAEGIFLSGNGPLVTVLKTALVRDKISQEEEELRQEEARRDQVRGSRARRGVRALVQDAYEFRNDVIKFDVNPPTLKRSPEHVIIFDEAQRAWDRASVESYMEDKKGILGVKMSEPELIMGSLDQHEDWCVMVCLVGGGQDIHTGETGLVEWIETVKNKFRSWTVYTSDELKSRQYIKDRDWEELVAGVDVKYVKALYLSASMRSFKNENVSKLINTVLQGSAAEARAVYDARLRADYPIVVSRDLDEARGWVRTRARGSQRCGLLVHSLAGRMEAFGVYYDKNRIQVADWFINGPEDVRSSYRMEVPASEFETQGLEVEYAVVCWDADLRRENGKWAPYAFGISKKGKAPDWIKMDYNGDEDEKSRVIHLINSYRVLLTRARQGIVIYVPQGIGNDPTINPDWYDSIYNHLHNELGIPNVNEWTRARSRS